MRKLAMKSGPSKFMLAAVLTGAAVFGATQSACAVQLLSGGDFEPVGGSVPGWDLLEFATGSGTVLDTAQRVGFGPVSGEWDLWNRPFVGGEDPGPDNLTNSVLSQVVPGTAGETYTFKGSSRWETNYSGGVTTLTDGGPLGAVASPTYTQMKLEFLDGSGGVLGTPTVLDLRPLQANISFWEEHTLNGTAPAGTVNVRVTAEARDMVWNVGPNQSAFYDNFKLDAGSNPGTELLVNPDLEDEPSTGLEAWTVTNDDTGNSENEEVIRTASFANRTPGGQRGVWMSSFFGEPATPVNGMVSQTVDAMEGGVYTFAGWSRMQANFSGGLDTPTQTFMEIAFLDSSEQVIGSPTVLDVKADRVAQSPTNNAADDAWYQHTFGATAPDGAASVRVSAGMIDGQAGPTNPQSGFFDDFTLDGPGVLLADVEPDGDVDGADFLSIQRTNPALISLWESEFGSGVGALSAASGTVPEPSSAVCLLLGSLVTTLGARRAKRRG